MAMMVLSRQMTESTIAYLPRHISYKCFDAALSRGLSTPAADLFCKHIEAGLVQYMQGMLGNVHLGNSVSSPAKHTDTCSIGKCMHLCSADCCLCRVRVVAIKTSEQKPEETSRAKLVRWQAARYSGGTRYV